MRKNLEIALDFVVKKIKKEIENQGHKVTGNLINSVRYEIKQEAGGWIGRVFIADYGAILDKGVKPNRVPYSPGSGAKSSKYIDALIGWIKKIKPGISETNSKSFAFAIARKAKKEGHPTKGSFAFSKNGRRTGWAKASITANRKQIITLLDLSGFVAASVDESINKIRKII